MPKEKRSLLQALCLTSLSFEPRVQPCSGLFPWWCFWDRMRQRGRSEADLVSEAGRAELAERLSESYNLLPFP